MPDILIKLGTDAAGTVKSIEQVAVGLDNVEKKGKTASASMKALEVAGAAAAKVTAAGFLVASAAATGTAVALKLVIDRGGQLADMAAKTGLATSSLQKLEAAAKLGGNSLEQVTGAVTKMQKAIVEGDTVFKRLGLNIDELRKKKPEDQFAAIAAQIQKIPDPAQRSAAAMEVFGKSGAEILPTLLSDLKGVGDEAERLGRVLSDDTVKAADQLGDEVDTLTDTWMGLVHQFGGAIAQSEALHQAVRLLTEIVGSLSRAVIANKDTIIGWVSTGISFALTGVAKLITGVAALKQAWTNIGIFGGMVEEAGLESRIKQLNPKNATEARAIQEAQAQLYTIRMQRAMMMQDSDAEATKVMALVQQIDDLARNIKASGAATVQYTNETNKLGGALTFVGSQADKLKGKLNFNHWIDPQGDLGLTRLRTPWNEQLLQGIPEMRGGRILGDFAIGTQQRIGQTAGLTAGNAYTEAFKKAFAGLPAVILSALQGGGSVGKSIGAYFGGSIGESLQKPITNALQNVLGRTLGGALGAAVPGIGALLGGAIGGLFGKLFGGGARKRAEEEKQGKDLLSQFDSLFKKIEEMQRNFTKAGGEAWVSYTQEALKATDITEDRLQRLARMGVGAFAAMRRAGFGFLESIRVMNDGLLALQRRADELGLDLGEAFKRLSATAEWAETHAGAIQMAEDLAKWIDALRAMGMVTADVLKDLANEAFELFKQLGGDIDDLTTEASRRALVVLAPTLFRIREEARRLGLTLDETTQKLIDAADAGGLFDGLKDPMDALNEALRAMVVLLAELVQHFGVKLPAAVQEYINKLNSIPGVPGPPGGPQQPPPPSDPNEGPILNFRGYAGFASGAVNAFFPARRGGHWLNVAEGGRGEYVTVTHGPVAMLSKHGLIGSSRVPKGVTHAEDEFFTSLLGTGGGQLASLVNGTGGGSIAGLLTGGVSSTSGASAIQSAAASLAAAAKAVSQQPTTQLTVAYNPQLVVQEASIARTRESNDQFDALIATTGARLLRNNNNELRRSLEKLLDDRERRSR